MAQQSRSSCGRRALSTWVTIIEAPDDETVAALVLDALKLGNVTCETSRGFTASEMEKILARMR